MSEHTDGFCSIEEALTELREGRMIVLVDDEHRDQHADAERDADHRGARNEGDEMIASFCARVAQTDK